MTKLKALLLILFCTTLMNVNVSAMEEGQCSKEQPADVLYVLPAEVFDMIIVAHLKNSRNIHELLQRIATLYRVSQYFKKYFEQRYPDLLVVLHGIDSNDEDDCNIIQDYYNRIAATKASLYDRGFSINERSCRAQTLLHQAVKGDASSKVIKTLLNLGANPTLLDSLRYSAYTLAQKMGNSDIVALFNKILSHNDTYLLTQIKPYKATHLATQALVNKNFDVFDKWLERQTKEDITQQFDGHSIYKWLTRTIEDLEKLTEYMKRIAALGLKPTVKLMNTACQTNNVSKERVL